jgi:AraC-like DNA-binding protein
MGIKREIYRDGKNIYCIEKVKQPEENWPNDILRALNCLNENLFNQGFTIATMRQMCNIPQKNFSSRFKYFVGYTPSSYLKNHRIKCSTELIQNINSNFSMSDLAFEVGYEYPSTFGNAFKSIIGLSPKEYWNFYKKK